MNARIGIGQVAEAWHDEYEYQRKARKLELETLENAATFARGQTWASVDMIAKCMDEIPHAPHESDVLVLVNAVWKYAMRNSNQHLDLWKSVANELESVQLTLIDAMEEGGRE